MPPKNAKKINCKTKKSRTESGEKCKKEVVFFPFLLSKQTLPVYIDSFLLGHWVKCGSSEHLSIFARLHVLAFIGSLAVHLGRSFSPSTMR